MRIIIKAVLFLLFLIPAKSLGQFHYPPCAAYDTVGKDTIRVINSYSNSLYAGIDNYIEIDTLNVHFKNLIVECFMGMTMEDPSCYNIIPAKVGKTYISIYQFDSIDTVLVIKKLMKVLPVPSPYITFNEQKLEAIKYLTKDELFKFKKFGVHLSDDFINDKGWYKIKEITVGFPMGQVYVTKSCLGDSLSDEILKSLSRILSGKEVSFSFTIVGEGELFKRMEPLRINLY